MLPQNPTPMTAISPATGKSAKPRSRWSRLYHRRRRARLLSMVLATVALAVFVATAAILLLAFKPLVLTVAAGPRDGIDAKILQEVSRKLAQEESNVRLKLNFTDNPEGGFALVSGGRADLAIARSDRLPEDALSVAVIRKRNVILWSPGKDKPAALKDVKGGRVGVIDGTPDDIALVRHILHQGGHSLDVVAMPMADLAKPSPGLSLIALVAHPQSRIVADALAVAGQPHFLAVDAADAIVRRQPRLESDELPKGALSSTPLLPSEALQTIRVAQLLVASKTLSEDKGAALARALYSHRLAILRESPAEAALEQPATDKDSAIPAHAGVAAYIDGIERTFMDRYSDLLWGTVLLLSGLGSAGAWFRAFYYRDEIDNSATMRDQLLELVAEARAETAPEKLAAMELKADALLRETLDRYEAGALDEGTLSAFGMALEHFRDVARQQKA